MPSPEDGRAARRDRVEARVQWLIAPRVLAGVSLALLLAVLAGCGSHRAAAPPAKTPAKYTERQVLAAFKSVGLRLRNPEPNIFVVVKRLVTAAPHDGWSVAAYLYPTRSQATASYSEDAGSWSRSGFASAEAKNLVIVVAPAGRALTRRAKTWAMPSLVYAAIHALARPARK